MNGVGASGCNVDALAVETAFDVDGQSFSAVFVNQCQHPERATIARLVVYKGIAPHMVALPGSKPRMFVNLGVYLGLVVFFNVGSVASASDALAFSVALRLGPRPVTRRVVELLWAFERFNVSRLAATVERRAMLTLTFIKFMHSLSSLQNSRICRLVIGRCSGSWNRGIASPVACGR